MSVEGIPNSEFFDFTEPCPQCNKRLGLRILEPSGPHAGRYVCICGHFRGWVARPASRNRPAAHRDLVAKHGNGRCQLCDRHVDDLPPGQVLEAHHVNEYARGGPPTAENVWIICTACHRLIEWVRSYI